MTLAWNGDDVARAMGTLFQEDGRAKYIDLPLSNYSTWPNDKVLKDGKMVGVSTFSGYSYNERSMLSLAMVDVDQSEPGTEVTLVWGEEGGGSAKPVVERHVQTEIRAIVGPAPYAEVVRTSYRPQLAVGADVELLGLYWTVSGPVVVHVGREWSLFDWADRCAEARKVGFSGLGLWHADLEHVLETRSLREMKQVFDDNGLRHLELEFLMDWFLDPGRRAPPGFRRDPRAAPPTPPASSMRTTSRSATSPACRPSSRSSPSASASSARRPPSTPTRRSSTSSCPST